MVYKFDPKYWNGTIFEFEQWETLGNHLEYRRENKPIPASYFPKSLRLIDASESLPDMFHTYQNLIVFSERARAVVEEWAPGQVEFIPVKITAVNVTPKILARLKLDNAYYFINVLGRAQRFQWPEMPIDPFPNSQDGVQRFASQPDYHQWKLRQREPNEPYIWREIWWQVDNKEFRGHVDILVEDILWQELDANFADQLNAMKVGR